MTKEDMTRRLDKKQKAEEDVRLHKKQKEEKDEYVSFNNSRYCILYSLYSGLFKDPFHSK